MVKKSLKRPISEIENGASATGSQGTNKKPRRRTMDTNPGFETVEDTVEEFLKLTGMKQTRLKGSYDIIYNGSLRYYIQWFRSNS